MIDRIQTLNNNNIKPKHNSSQSFKGTGALALTGLRMLNNSPAIGACAVDLCSMVIPRTCIEWKNRGRQSGTETLIREGTSNLIHTGVGIIGLGAATAISGKFNREFGIKAQNIFASGDTIQSMSELWKNAGGQKKEFFQGFVQNIKGLSGSKWQTVSEAARDDIVQGMVALSDKAKEQASAKGISQKLKIGQEVKKLKSLLISKVTKETGAQASFKMNAINGSKELSSSFPELLDNAVSLSNSFQAQAKDKMPKFLDALKKNKVASTILGMGICAALCMSVQPINRYLTKKRTGSDGFVGVDNSDTNQKNKPQGYKVAKTVLGTIFPLAALRTIGQPKDLISNIQFNSKVPRLNQFKFLYGLTIASRFMSARDGNELRESVIKDTLGFTNWLILGGMVSKLVARGIGGKELINNPIVKDGTKKGFMKSVKYAAKWLTKASVKSFDEVLLPKAKNITQDGKLLSFKELYKNANSYTKSQVKKIAGSQIAGYLYSGFVLGVGIAKLNISITKRLNERKKAKDKMNDEINGNNNAEKVDNKQDTKNYSKLMGEQLSSVFKEFN